MERIRLSFPFLKYIQKIYTQGHQEASEAAAKRFFEHGKLLLIPAVRASAPQLAPSPRPLASEVRLEGGWSLS
jgi:hypothetical protein